MPVRTVTPDRPARLPLVVTADPALLDDLIRLAAAGSCEVQVAMDATAARPSWSSAPFVLLGADVAEQCTRAGLATRAALILVARDDIEEPPWRLAEALRAEQVAVL